MGRPRTYRCEGVVLKSVPLGEAGLLVTLYTTTLGTLRAAARGVRKTTSKMVGHLEPLNRVELALATGRGGLDIVTQAQVLETFASLKADLEGSSRGLYLAELVDGFGTERSAGPELHTLLVDTLRFLSDSSDRELTSRHFELHLLRVSGFMPELYRCVECKGELVQGGHRFSPDVGGTLCITCTPPKIRIMGLSVQALKVLRFLHRASLPDLPSLRVQGGLQDEVRGLLSAALVFWLDREVRSRSFVEHLRRPPAAAGATVRGVQASWAGPQGSLDGPR